MARAIRSFEKMPSSTKKVCASKIKEIAGIAVAAARAKHRHIYRTERALKTSTNDTTNSAEGTLVSHLIELRDRLIRGLGSVLVVFLVLAPFANDLYEVLASPLMSVPARRQQHDFHRTPWPVFRAI